MQITVNCSTCGKHIERDRCEISRYSHHYCSVECRSEGCSSTRKKKVCSMCGSKKLYDPGWSRLPRALCKKCFKRWAKMRNKGAHRREIQCYICGAPYQRYLTYFAGKNKWKRFAWACPDCRNRAVSCHAHRKFNISKPKPNTCVDCGGMLAGVKHTSSSRYTCDLCMMERRRSYKDKAEYGDLAEAFNLARTAKIIANVGQEIVTKGESSWLKKYPIWKQKIQRLKSTL